MTGRLGSPAGPTHAVAFAVESSDILMLGHRPFLTSDFDVLAEAQVFKVLCLWHQNTLMMIVIYLLAFRALSIATLVGLR